MTRLASRQPVTLIGGAPVPRADLDAALALAPVLAAADGGADAALANGLVPQAVWGDFDSISPQARAAIPTENLHRIAEQDSTDFEKCLSRIDAPLVIAVGFSQLGSGQMRHLKSVSLPDWVDVQIIPVNGAARRGEPMKKVTDIAIHYVGNPGTTAQAKNRPHPYATATRSSRKDRPPPVASTSRPGSPPSPIPPAPSRWEGERVALCRQGCRLRGASLASPAPCR